MSQHADQSHRVWMRQLLDRAADKFELNTVGTPTMGWNDRSICSAATAHDGSRRWLRVVTEHLSWAGGDWWTGNADATAISDVAKPRVIDIRDWTDDGRAVRAETMTYLAGHPCSSTPELRSHITLTAQWWAELSRSLDHLAAFPTRRRAVGQDRVSTRLQVFFGDQIDTRVQRWTTAHADLHWANLMAPEFAIVDWELWGRAPFGYDAATIYCCSLLSPDIAATVRATFGDILDSPDGVLAQLYVITRMLLRAEQGDHPDLVIPLHHHARGLLAAPPARR